MIIAKKNILLILWAFSNILNAQTNNFWYDFRQGFSFDQTGNLVYYFGLTNDYSGVNNSAIADFNGKPLLYTNGGTVYNSKNYVINNGNGLKSSLNNINSYCILSLDTNNYIVYGIPKSDYRIGDFNDSLINYSYIKRDLNVIDQFFIPLGSANFQLKFNENLLCISSCRDADAQPVMVIRTKNYFYSYKILHGGVFKFLDSLYYPENVSIPDSLSKNPFLRTSGISSQMQLSNRGEFIAFNDYYAVNTKFPDLRYFTSSNRFLMPFDKQTGKFGSPKMINTNIWHKLLTPTKFMNYYFDGFCFSPNDSFLYYHNVSSDMNVKNKHQEEVYQYDVYGNSLPKLIFFEANTKNANIAILNLNHLGEIFFFNADANGNKFYLNKIKQPNKNYPQCVVQMQTEILSPKFQMFTQNNKHLYDYIRTNKTIKYDCVAKVDYKNLSQTWIGFTDFTWHIKNDSGGEDYYKSFEPPQLVYTKNGDYTVKVFASSPRGKGYGEWYIDTIKIRIPIKPVANFYARDSVVCRYTDVKFVNYSNAKDTLSNFYLWSFGDGNTSSEKTPMHVYSTPGTYTVTLLYKNGYCDSTLTKNQYIKVVDAPKPGFSVLYKQGCSPFTANFTDTVTLNVKQKDYYFSDIKTWQNITNPNFTHTFNKPGVYTAVQRLSGYTGCVIQTDSVVFNISKGLTKADTLHVFNSSVENNNALIYWNSLNGAVKYQLYKDGNLYKQQNDTFFKEGSPYTKDVIYTVAGIDSCGNKSSIGRIGKPIFLQGNLIGNNEASIIFFSPYQQWNGVDITYKIQKLINGTWLTVNSEKVNADFLDNQFLNKLELQTCYRIEAYESSQPLVLSHSNEICIPYIPTIFVPNAFSPNGDLINDVFDVTCFGIDKYKFTVYNRWGQEVFRGLNKEAWDGGDASEGVYLIAIEYTTNSGIKLHQRITVTLLR